MNSKLKKELKESYSALMKYLDEGGSEIERAVILDKLCEEYDKLKRIK